MILILLISSILAFGEPLAEGGWWPCNKILHFECQSLAACGSSKLSHSDCQDCTDPKCGCTIRYENAKDDWQERQCFRKGNEIYLDKFAKQRNGWNECDPKLHPECLPSGCQGPRSPAPADCDSCGNKYCGCTLDFITSHGLNGKVFIDKRLCYRSGSQVILGVYISEP
jgi:hypothetical protein